MDGCTECFQLLAFQPYLVARRGRQLALDGWCRDKGAVWVFGTLTSIGGYIVTREEGDRASAIQIHKSSALFVSSSCFHLLNPCLTFTGCDSITVYSLHGRIAPCGIQGTILGNHFWPLYGSSALSLHISAILQEYFCPFLGFPWGDEAVPWCDCVDGLRSQSLPSTLHDRTIPQQSMY